MLLAVAPTYVGLTGAARLVDLPVLPVRAGADGVELDDLAEQVRRARASGLRPRACYLMPDFANPSGITMTVEVRRRLLALARAENILLLEDNPYGLFPIELADRIPTCKALDDSHTVVYLGSFAKTALPGARVGYVVADQPVRDAAGNITLLADQLSKLKSMLTVNTSPISQAIVAGKMLEHGGSLIAATAADRAVYGKNLRLMLDGLAARFRRPVSRHQLQRTGRQLLRGGHGAVRGGRRAAGAIGRRLRGAVDADASLLHRRQRGELATAELQRGHPGRDRARSGPAGGVDPRPDGGIAR